MRQKGFSLIETLVVISIISILSGILLPVIVNSKTSARKTDDLTKLRQMGQAAAIYESTYGDYPLSSSQLTASGMIPKELCASMNDQSPSGIANDLAAYNIKRFGAFLNVPQTNYKSSFVGLAEFGISKKGLDELVQTGPSGGWLIDATLSERSEFPSPSQWKGTYRRLTLDGAVIVKPHRDFTCDKLGTLAPCRMPILMFVDPGPQLPEVKQ
jgi:prepilin-type N-terminal cleavage/methylation domain-containing protein